MPNAEGRGIFGFPKEGSGIGANPAVAVYAVKAVPVVSGGLLLNDPCDNFTLAPWVLTGTPTVVGGGHVGNAFSFPAGSANRTKYTIATPTVDLTVGIWVNLIPGGSLWTPISFRGDAQVNNPCDLILNANGSLTVGTAGAPIATSAAGVIPASTWTLIEMQCHNGAGTAGSVVVRVNGTPVITNMACNTRGTATASTYDGVWIQSTGGGISPWLADDIYIRNDLTFGTAVPPPAGDPGVFSPATYVYQWCNNAWVPVWSNVVYGPVATPVATYVSAGTSVTITWVEPSPAFSGTWIVKRSDGSVVTTVASVTPGTTINVSDDSPLFGTNAYTVTKQIGTTLSTPATSNTLTLDFTPTAAPTATTDPGVVGTNVRVIHLTWVDGPSGNPDSWKILDSSGGLVTTVAGNLNTVDITVQAGYNYRYTVVPVLAGRDGTGKAMAGNITTKANPPTDVQVYQTGPPSGGAFPYDTVWVAPSQGFCGGIEFQRSWDGGATWLAQGTRGCNAWPFSDIQSTTHTTVCRRIRTLAGNNPSDWVIAYPCPLNLF